MTAKEIMTKDVLAVVQDDLARHAVEIMADSGVSGLPVVNEREELVGIVTEKDLLLIEEKKTPILKNALYGLYIAPDHLVQWDAEHRGLQVRDLMTKHVITFGPDDSVHDIARMMHDKNINRVPIVDEGKIVGIVSRHDIIKSLAEGKSLS